MSILGIDHLVILVKDLDASRDVFAALGFRMTPRGTHSPHMGTGNYLFILERDYVELLGVVTPTENNAEWRAKLDQSGEGLTGMALATHDPVGAHSTLMQRGLAPMPPLEFSRPVEVPGGTREAAFAVIRLPPETVPGLNLFVCGHKTRELVWRPEWQTHPNSATRILQVTLPVSDLDGAIAAWERPFGATATRNGSGSEATIRTGTASLRLVRSGTPTIRFAAQSLSDAARVLDRNGVPHTTAPTLLTVEPAHACGVQIEFAMV
jgi:catechol 2,3-dioxygenase-like lactoylglutathione lyase family enzyme